MLWILSALACGAAAPTTSEALAAADAHDGTVDKTVSECTSCGLGMKGDAAHTTQHEGYELQFCSDTCKRNFEDDPEAGVNKLKTATAN